MNVETVVEEAKSWLGTPYHHNARLKGVGVDCAQILIGVFSNAGLVEAVDVGNYAHDWHLHHSEEIYQQWLSKYADIIEPQDARAGDLALFKFGRCYSHGAIIVPGGLIHAYVGLGVIFSRIDEEPLSSRPVLYWRLR